MKKLFLCCLLAIACFGGSIDEIKSAYNSGYKDKAMRLSVKYCDDNSLNKTDKIYAYGMAGALYYHEKQDFKNAIKYCKKGCNLGNAGACNVLNISQ